MSEESNLPPEQQAIVDRFRESSKRSESISLRGGVPLVLEITPEQHEKLKTMTPGRSPAETAEAWLGNVLSEVNSPEKVAWTPNSILYDVLCMDLEACWLKSRNPVFLYLRYVDEPAHLVEGRDPKPYMMPDVAETMRGLIRKSKQGKIWSRDWKLTLLWAESSDEGLTLEQFCEAHADSEAPSTLAKGIVRVQKRMERHAKALEQRERGFRASKMN